MSLIEIVTMHEYINLVDEVLIEDNEKEVLKSVLLNLYMTNRYREVRPTFSWADIKDYSISYFNVNRQRLKYILSTSTEEFIGTENNRESEINHRLNNSNFFAENEGMMESDINNSREKVVNINRKHKTYDMKSLESNQLFKIYLDTFLETFMMEDIY